jgi:1,4-alpha-glucan branching enzyme
MVGLWIPADARREVTYQRIQLLEMMVGDFDRVGKQLENTVAEANARYPELRMGIAVIE